MSGGQQGYLPEPPVLPSPRALLPMAAKGLSQPRRGLRYLQAPASPQLLPRHQSFASPPEIAQTLGTTHTNPATLHPPYWALFPSL